MLNRRTFLKTSVATTAASILSGCGGSQKILEIAMLQNSIPPQLVGSFRKIIKNRNQIKLKPEAELQTIFDSLEAWQKTDEKQSVIDAIPIVGKGRNKQANMVTLGDSWLQKAIADNLIQPLDTSKLSGWENLSSEWKTLVKRDRNGNKNSQGKIYGAPYRWGNTAIAYRKDKINWTPTDWSDLWREELKGRISLLNSDREVIGLTLKKLGYSYNTTNLDLVSNLESELQSLNRQVKFYSSDKYLQPLALGDTWLAVGWSTDIFSLVQRYPDIEVVVPASGTSLWADLWVQPRSTDENEEPDSKNQNQGISSLMAEWIDFCWATEAAKQILLFTDGIPVNAIEQNAPKIAEDLKNNLAIAEAIANFNKSEFLLPLSAETSAQYLQLWQKIRS